MTNDKSLFQELDGNRSGNITFSYNSKDVLYGEGLMHNLLSISQLHDNGFKICIDTHACHIINSSTKKIISIGKGMRLCMLFILMILTFIMNHACVLMM